MVQQRIRKLYANNIWTRTAIEYYHLHNSAGNVGPAVFISADPDMDDDEFEWVQIVGLSNTNTMVVDSSVFLCFDRTRNRSARIYAGSGKHIVIPFVELIRMT